MLAELESVRASSTAQESHHEALREMDTQLTESRAKLAETQEQLAESEALVADLKKSLEQTNQEKEEIAKQLKARTEELASFKSSSSLKTSDAKQQARYTQRISDLEQEVEKAKKHAAEVLEEGKALAKKQLEIETKDRALKAKLRERNEELSNTKSQLADTSFRLEKTTETVMRLQQELQSATSSQSTNSKRLEELEKEHANLLQLHDEREKLYAAQKNEFETLAASFETLTSDHESMKMELSRLQTEQEASADHVKQMEELVSQSTEAFNQLQAESNSRERALEVSLQRCEEAQALGICMFSDLHAALAQENYDAALVCTAPLTHAGIIDALLDAALNVFTELNLVSDGYEALMKKAADKNLVLFLSSTMLYRAETQYIKQKVQAFDKPVNYLYHIGQYLPDWHPWESYKNFFVGDKRTGGVREIFGIDLPWLIDTFGEVERIHVEKDSISTLEIDYPDSCFVTLRHKNGVKG